MRIKPYQEHALRYDRWFDDHRLVYEAELQAVRTLLPASGRGVEVGVGTGRFAAPLGICIGVEPSESMAVLAQQRGVKVIGGVAEALPLGNATAEFILMVTVICFVSDLQQTFREAWRVLADRGQLVVAMIDRNSPLGQKYAAKKQQGSLFYQQATFYAVDEVVSVMQEISFAEFSFCQTIYQDVSASTAQEQVQVGHGEGLFAVIRGVKR
jgi:SAM-dependent methyltransferase